ncbi:glycosyltransferase family protein [Croceimicrobium hydrocarbonivorans]|uniref:Glycosyltransferase subfamily 4-like N-terminal domain-containing protein n=1 Tax=Croceimicrobium hydrocarbonivorans TaxID=2761580 RepID=A0A7H0VGD7_9FLAO|nr:hypothetical protein [Croceimicrobium hydrocarbonivorans]QNR24785.1 hypothetical protein H4K34_02765 [Croceimicrobium hydrocarbonivorans]
MISKKDKRLLVVSYYWLPDEGTGSFRISKFVKYLLQAGWEITILTASRSRGDDQQVPGLKVVRTDESLLQGESSKVNPSIFYAAKSNWRARIKVWLRLNIIIPDAKIFWYPKALSFGKKLIKENHYSAVLSTAPPPTTALVAKAIASSGDLPLISDFRDPWTNIYYYEDFPLGRIARYFNNRLEKSVLKASSDIICVNKGFFPGFEEEETKVHYISNGFDPDDFGKHQSDQSERSKKFTVSYFGSLKMNQVSPGFLAFIQNIPEGQLANLRFHFYGNVDQIARDSVLKVLPENLELVFKGTVPHDMAVQEMQKSDLLLLLVGMADRSKLVYSTKLFEYLNSAVPCLAFGHQDGAAAHVIKETNAGHLSSHQEYLPALQFLEERLADWKAGLEIKGASVEALDRFNFKKLSTQLENVILSRI